MRTGDSLLQYHSPGWNHGYPRLQILTIPQLLQGVTILYPPRTGITFKEAPRAGADEQAKARLPGL